MADDASRLLARYVSTDLGERVVWAPERRSRDAPLILGFHGGMAGAAGFAERSGLLTAFGDLGLPIQFPQAIEHWSDGRPPLEEGWPHDRSLIESMLREDGANGRPYALAGVSNGGMFALRLACEMTPPPAAVATVVAAMPQALAERMGKGPPVPIMIVQGTEDRVIPWDGGEVLEVPGITAGGALLSADATVAFWLRRNRCSGAPRLRRAAIGEFPVTIRVWSGGANGADVWRVVLRGGTHFLLDHRAADEVHGSLGELLARFVAWHVDRGRLVPPERPSDPRIELGH